MLDKLRDLFLSALECDNDYKAKLLVDKWNEEIKRLQKIYDTMTSKATIARHGQWININPMVDSVQCSNCGYQVQSIELTTPYCPWCGAKMQESKE